MIERGSEHKDIKFILDRTLQEQQKALEEVLRVVQKKPYPTEESLHLATFIHALYQTAPFIKHPQLKKIIAKQEKEVEKIKEAEKQEIRRSSFNPFSKPLPMPPKPHHVIVNKKEIAIPVPMAPQQVNVPKIETPIKEELPTLEPKKREYVVNLFGTPVGILIAPDEKTFKLTYRVIEPVIDSNVLKLTKDYIKKDFQKDYKILDHEELLREKVEKACKKSKVQFTEDYPKKIKYYLKRDLAGFRRIDPMMQDNNVKAVYVHGINRPVIIEFGDNIEKIQSNVFFTDSNDLNVLISKLARLTGSEINESNPILNTVFQGIKIQATLGFGGTASKLIIKKVMY